MNEAKKLIEEKREEAKIKRKILRKYYYQISLFSDSEFEGVAASDGG